MKDAAHAATDRQIAELERRLVKLYANAEKGLKACITAFFEQFEEQDEEKRKQLEAGEITKKDFVQWRLAQIARGKQFEKVRDAVALEMLKANQEATELTAEAMPDVYSVNYEQEATEINSDEGTTLPLVLTAAAIYKIVKSFHQKMNTKKDVAWNKRKFTTSVTSGILRGLPLNGKDSVCEVTLEFIIKINSDSARTNARTVMTTVETQARQNVYNAAAAVGVHRVKTWYTVQDNRVRDAHIAMNGVSVPWTENFIVDGYEMIGPRDRSVPSYLWYNCRCRMKSEKMRGEMDD